VVEFGPARLLTFGAGLFPSRCARFSAVGIDGEINSILASPLRFLCSLDHLIRSGQHVGRNREADLLGGFQIDDELKLRRLFYGLLLMSVS
jgi:hypothetical protein